MSSKIIYRELSYRIVGQAMHVYRGMGPGFLEKVYENALMKRLRDVGIEAKQQIPVRISFEDIQVGRHAIDILVEDKIILELKACSQLSPAFDRQVTSYLKATGLKLAILLNFGGKQFEMKRFVKTDPVPKDDQSPAEPEDSPIN